MGKKKNTGKNTAGQKNTVTESAYKESFTGLKKKTLYDNLLLHIGLIALLAFIAYSNSFFAPFTFDDLRGIAEDPKIKEFGYLVGKAVHSPWNLSNRYVGFLTFALNYQLNGFDVAGYHVFNFIVHLSNSILVYFLVVCTFRTPYLIRSEIRGYAHYIAFFSGLLFAVHPIQTQAVTYIVQRVASLATFFYLLSVVMYIKWRLTWKDTNNRSIFEKNIFYILSLVSAVLAMKTKEIAFTLPVMLVLYEFLFFEGSPGKRLLNLAPIAATMLIIPLGMIRFGNPEAVAIANMTRLETDVSRWDYLITQFRVIVTYLRLMIFPVNQNLDYDYPLYYSFFSPPVFFSFVLLFLLFIMCVYLLLRYRNRYPQSRIISFGIFWFFIALSVESSFIPILDLIYEHRMYLPSVGVLVSFCCGLFWLASCYKEKWKHSEKTAWAVLIVLSVIFVYATFERNWVWKDNISLWEDAVKKSPAKARPHYNLGTVYMEKYFAGRTTGGKPLIDRAVEQFQAAIRLDPKHAGAHNNLGNAYIMKGLLDKAAESYETSLKLKPENADATGNLGNIYLHQGLTDKAIQCYMSVLKLKPENADAHFNLGIAYMKKQENSTALEEFRTALRIKPAMKEAEDYINIILQSKNKRQQSRMNE